VGLERGQLSLVSTIGESLDRKVAAPFYKIEITVIGDQPRWPRYTPLSAKVGTTPTSGGRSVGIIRRGLNPRSYY
jgi:hypothetical protein